MLSSSEVKEKAGVITQQMSGLAVSDALRVISRVMEQVLNKPLKSSDPLMGKPFVSAIANFLPRHIGGRSRIDSDSELKTYIHSIQERRTMKQIANMCQVKFGKKRAPSKSAVGRYIKKITEQLQEETANHE